MLFYYTNFKSQSNYLAALFYSTHVYILLFREKRSSLKASLNLQFFISIRTLLDQFVLFRPQRGREGQKCQNLLSKKTTKGEGGGHKIGKMGRRRLWMAPQLKLKQGVGRTNKRYIKMQKKYKIKKRMSSQPIIALFF